MVTKITETETFRYAHLLLEGWIASGASVLYLHVEHSCIPSSSVGSYKGDELQADPHQNAPRSNLAKTALEFFFLSLSSASKFTHLCGKMPEAREFGAVLSGNRKGNHKFTAIQRAAMCAKLSEGKSYRAVALEFNTSASTAHSIFKRWKNSQTFETKLRKGRPKKSKPTPTETK